MIIIVYILKITVAVQPLPRPYCNAMPMPAVLLPGVDFDLGALDSHLGLAERAGWKRCGKLPDELIVSQYNGSQILERQCAKYCNAGNEPSAPQASGRLPVKHSMSQHE